MGAHVHIALFRGSGVVSRLIRWQTRSEFSHAALVFADNYFVEAREFIGVRAGYGLPQQPNESVTLFRVAAGIDQVNTIRAFAEAQRGKRYDYTMVARFVTRRQATRSSSEKWFCSELVFAAFLEAGISLLRATEPWEVSPGLLARSPLLKPDSE